MFSAHFLLHPSFAPFLASQKRRANRAVSFRGSPAVKHVLEGFGIPHTEIGEIVANHRTVDLSYPLQDGDRMIVYPVRVPDEALSNNGPPGFILDNHLGRLAAALRLMGFDTLYRNDYQDEELAAVAVRESRVLLTRDRGLLMRKVITLGYWVRNREPDAQLLEVILRYSLLPALAPFRRCPRCNTPLQPVDKSAVLDDLEPLTRLYYDQFHRCPGCGQVYWQGSHVERILQRIERLKSLLSLVQPGSS